MTKVHDIEKKPSVSLRDARMKLPKELQALLPEELLWLYERNAEMHFDPEVAGGSKFLEKDNIFELVAERPDIPEKVGARQDDREKLRALGAPDSAFLPAVKEEGAPPRLPEALYYIVEGVEGRVNMMKLKDLDPETLVMIKREKGVSDVKDAKEYTPVSITTLVGSTQEMPVVDFATVIFGRDFDEQGEPVGDFVAWTTHPGLPVRPGRYKEYSFTQDIKSPEELEEGEKQNARIVTVRELLSLFPDMKEDDHVKVAEGDWDQVKEEFEILENPSME